HHAHRAADPDPGPGPGRRGTAVAGRRQRPGPELGRPGHRRQRQHQPQRGPGPLRAVQRVRHGRRRRRWRTDPRGVPHLHPQPAAGRRAAGVTRHPMHDGSGPRPASFFPGAVPAAILHVRRDGARVPDTPMHDIRLVGFDGDDTLWRSEDYYRAAEKRYEEIIGRYIDLHDAGTLRHLLEVERRNLKVFGYGVKGMTLSMIEAAIE